MKLRDCDWQADMVAAWQAVGPDIVLGGELDPVSEVNDGTAETIRAAMKTTCETEGNRLMAGAGCRTPPGTPAGNLKASCTPAPHVP